MQQKTKNLVGIVVAGVVAVGLGLALASYLFQRGAPTSLPEGLNATYLPKGKPLTDFHLVDYHNQPYDLSRLKGKWTFIYFGYTHCPDVCPATLQVMKQVWNKLPRQSFTKTEPQMLFVSVDPERDTPDDIKKYLKYFDADFVGATAPPDQLDVLVNQLGALYGYDDGPAGSDSYQVNHSSQLFLIDPQARMRAVLSPPQKPDEILQTLLTIKKYSEG
jgi:protein SCO1/2